MPLRLRCNCILFYLLFFPLFFFNSTCDFSILLVIFFYSTFSLDFSSFLLFFFFFPPFLYIHRPRAWRTHL
ncbi:hypothetical protein FN846DRAFT_954089 [Sphaerosporella brunnea]|uniref:Uncharacterized protein n=1 Tax=Sphaerosporella brunnea TaxID=1250544 RepID=A0A5J5EU33_9PEZI|nr:hypothetical protein FN846DRAFT_954089 [Sphaerosporella brunnea]